MWLSSILELSSTDLAKRLGITDRQARHIKTGKVGEARLREHAIVIMISRRKSAARACAGCGRILFYGERQLGWAAFTRRRPSG